jgi:hypothetical protein
MTMRWINAIAFICGGGVGLIMMLIAIDHNPQGALIDDINRELNFRYALMLFFSWFLVTAIATSGILAIFLILINRVKEFLHK